MARSIKTGEQADARLGRNSEMVKRSDVRREMKLRSNSRGFTLMEMMIVIMVMGVLMALALPMYTTSVTRSKEAKLQHNLVTLNNLIQQYTLDKKKEPQQLQDLVDAGYIKYVPDDITGSNTTWQTVNVDPEHAVNPDDTGGIASVHSGSDQTALDGSAYSSWPEAPHP